MTFEIKADIELTIVDGKYFLNDIELDEYTIKLLELDKLELSSHKENNNIIFNLSPDTIAFIKQKYFKN